MAGRTSSARFGSVGVGGDFITFRLQTKEFVRLVDRITNRFLGGGFQRALSRANELAAIQVQESIAEALDESIKEHRTRTRPRRPEQRTKMAILDAENREVLGNTFRVGIPAWYDRSPAALYWRLIEEEGIGSYTTEGFFSNPGAVGPRPSPTGQMALLQFHKSLKNGHPPPVIQVGAFAAYHYHRIGVTNAVGQLHMGAKYLEELRKIGLVMQLTPAALAGKAPATGFESHDLE
jgi:hypothetical protein